jgi:uncharacterized repeat protein (TIGR01451 family)
MVKMIESLVRNNIALTGGGIWNGNNSLININDSVVEGNKASNEEGGGIQNKGGTININDSTIRSNECLQNGGGVSNRDEGKLNLINTFVYDNNAGGNGAGLANRDSAMNLHQTSIKNNALVGGGLEGGGIYNLKFGIGASSILTITDSIISDNLSLHRGGGLMNMDGQVTISNTTISSNTAKNDSGGGVYNAFDSIIIEDSIIRGNQARLLGGGLVNATGGHMIVKRSLIENNVTPPEHPTENLRWGGGIANVNLPDLHTAILEVTQSTIRNNNAHLGGGIYNAGKGAIATIDKSTIYDNHANLKISANRGGGIYVRASALLTVTNSSISKNTAIKGSFMGIDGGGVASESGGVVNLINVTLDENSTSIRNDGGGISLTNTIVAGTIGVDADCVGTTSLGYNLDTDGSCSSQATDITDDPKLGPLQNNGGLTETHKPQEDSPVLDAGTCNTSVEDQRGFSRPMDISGILNVSDGCDMGAYELGPHLSIAKLVNSATAKPGEIITFTVVVSNVGSLNTATATISDTLPAELKFLGPISLKPADAGNVGDVNTLPIVASDLNITAGHRITVSFPVKLELQVTNGQPITNTASIASIEMIKDQAAITTVTVERGSVLSLTKVADVDSSGIGQIITYTYEVANIGNFMVTGLEAVDDRLGSIVLETTTLSPGQVATGVLFYTVKEADIPGPLTNTVVATGTVNGEAVTAIAVETVPITYQTQITVAQSVEPNPAKVGETITITYQVTNTGDISLTDVQGRDSRLGPITFDMNSLLPTQVATGTLTYTIEATDLPGPLKNTVIMTGVGYGDELISASRQYTININLTDNPIYSIYLPVLLKQ